MKNNKEIPWTQLKTSYKPTDFSFQTTDDLPQKEDILNRDAASNALEFGLKLPSKGYNLFVSGEDETTLFEYTMQLAKEVAMQKQKPQDIGYIYNFIDPSKPKSVLLVAGEGQALQDDLREFTAFLTTELSKRINTQQVTQQKEKLEANMEKEKEEVLKKLKKIARGLGIAVKFSSQSVGFIPIGKNNKPITESEYQALDPKEKKTIKKAIDKLSKLSETMLQELGTIEEKYMQYAEELEEEIILKEVGYFFGHLNEKYGHYPWLVDFLQGMSEDLVENISVFHASGQDDLKGLKEVIPWISQKSIQEVVSKYELNLVVNNKEANGAPIVYATCANYSNLLGKIQMPIEYDMGKISHKHIHKGLFHEANGGYLLIHASDLLEYPGAWEAIKKTLKSEQVTIENLSTTSIMNSLALEPEGIPADVKVILVGQYQLYRLLSEYDEDFKKLFKFHIDFEAQAESNTEYIEQLAYKIKHLMDKEQLPAMGISGLLYLVEYGNRLAESQEKMVTNLEPMMDLIREANVFSNGETIEKEHIQKAIQIREYLRKRIQKNIDEQYEKDILMIDVKGERVGQINGLAVYELDQFRFGRPSKITATTYKGQSGIVDIEKEAGLSGQIHSKGIQIITGFLGNQFAQDAPLSLSCRICFEQSYGTIDGDSASSAELYAILSSLADVAIDQSIAVTGSMNQHGEIQPIGGVNEKIEGFFKVCQDKGLTGKQGVMIPKQNIGDLMLAEEVIDAVKQGVFHIYAISQIAEGIEIMTGKTYEDVVTKVNEKMRRFTMRNVPVEKVITRRIICSKRK